MTHFIYTVKKKSDRKRSFDFSMNSLSHITAFMKKQRNREEWKKYPCQHERHLARLNRKQGA